MENIIAPVVTKKIKGTVYKIYNKNDETMFYIGSCSIPFKIRIQMHKSASKKSPFKLYKYIRDNEGFENFICKVIENIEVENIKELRQKEQDFIILLNPTLNSNIASSNIGIDQRIDKKLYNKLYQQSEKYKSYKKEYQQSEKYKSYQKRYTEKYKSYQKSYMKNYYQNHKKVKLNQI